MTLLPVPAPESPHPGSPPGAWVPVPVCTPGCLPGDDGGPRVGTLRFVARLGSPAVVLAAAVAGVFPEGTTWCGSAAGPFRRAAFQAAIDARVPVRPVAFVLWLPDGTTTGAGAFVGDQTLWDSLTRVLRLHEMTLLPDLDPTGVDPRRRGRRGRGRVTGVPHPVAAAARPVVEHVAVAA